jgi:hypothetical protein
MTNNIVQFPYKPKRLFEQNDKEMAAFIDEVIKLASPVFAAGNLCLPIERHAVYQAVNGALEALIAERRQELEAIMAERRAAKVVLSDWATAERILREFDLDGFIRRFYKKEPEDLWDGYWVETVPIDVTADIIYSHNRTPKFTRELLAYGIRTMAQWVVDRSGPGNWIHEGWWGYDGLTELGKGNQEVARAHLAEHPDGPLLDKQDLYFALSELAAAGMTEPERMTATVLERYQLEPIRDRLVFDGFRFFFMNNTDLTSR